MLTLPASSEALVSFLWWWTLGVGLIVALVVAGLLYWIHHEASSILGHVSRIWNVGQMTANNTVHIPALYATNALAVRILSAVGRIRNATASIERHAGSCHSCPQCLANP